MSEKVMSQQPDSLMLSIVEVVPCWTVTVNRDLTEGRGPTYIKHVTRLEATARRLAHKADVQGSHGMVREGFAVYVSEDGKDLRTFLVPGEIEGGNASDEKEERKLRERRENEARKAQALERARAAGLSDEDVEILKGEP